MSNQIQLRERASYSYWAHSWRQQTNPFEEKIWKCYKTIASYVSCVFIEIWNTREVWRARKMCRVCPCLIMHVVALWTLSHLTISLFFLHFVALSEPSVRIKNSILELNESKWQWLKTIEFLPSGKSSVDTVINVATPESNSPVYAWWMALSLCHAFACQGSLPRHYK